MLKASDKAKEITTVSEKKTDSSREFREDVWKQGTIGFRFSLIGWKSARVFKAYHLE